jgi:SpoVK/Ycf46/Vps4 family AAA+-type ATPase
LLAKAIGNQWGLPLISFTPGKIFSSRVGESEMRMMKALKIIESVAPCAVVIDEIEKQFSGSQSSTFSDAGTTSRVIGSFLTWYQDCTAPIFIIATCNSIQYLPPELVSRFDDKFFVPLPSNTDRASIYDIHLKKTGRDPSQLGINVQELASKSPYFTGREIEQVVKAGLIEMWYERKTTGNEIELNNEHLLKVLDSKVPMYKTMQEELDYLVQWVGWDSDKKEGIRANYASEREDDIDALFSEILAKDSVLDRNKRR